MVNVEDSRREIRVARLMSLGVIRASVALINAAEPAEFRIWCTIRDRSQYLGEGCRPKRVVIHFLLAIVQF